MKVNFLRLLTCTLFLCFFNFAHAMPGSAFNHIVFFGDSLSDDGNLYSYDLKYMPKSPPYFQGRFSNDYVWSDIISKNLAAKYKTTNVNYAFGGETAIFHSPTNGFLPYSLSMSRNSYLLHTAYQDRSKTLFIIWIGANDYLHDSIDVDGLTLEVVNSIGDNIQNLISHGGLNFLVMNLPDVGQTPLAKDAGMSELLHRFVLKHNERLSALISTLQTNYPQVSIKLYDVSAQFDDFMANIDYYNKKYNVNITNTTVACWQGGYTLAKNSATERQIAAEIDEYVNKQRKLTRDYDSRLKTFDSAEMAHHIVNSPDLMEAYQVSKQAEEGTGKACANPENYLFWDHLHPTTIMHMMFADGIQKFVEDNFAIEKTNR